MNYKHFGIPIFTEWKGEFLKDLEDSIKSWKSSYAVTPNPEMMLLQLQDERFRKILKWATWNLPDGFWLTLWSFLQNKNPSNIIFFAYYVLIFPFLKLIGYKTPISDRICWSDVFFDICKLCEENYFRIFLVWWWEGVAEEVKSRLERRYPEISIVWTSEGYDKANSDETASLIEKTKPQVIFVAMWAPNQEYWIEENLKKNPSIKFAIWVWWTFDFVTARQKRAPEFLRKMWLEWIYRLAKQPSRSWRIKNATFWYLWFVYKEIKKLKK